MEHAMTEDHVFTMDEARVVAVAARAQMYPKAVREWLTVKADENLLDDDERVKHQQFLDTAAIEELVAWLDKDLDAYYRQIER
jgi:hypothetical protein